MKYQNKEEEQIASLKFLRILGSHLKNPSKDVQGFQTAESMKNIYNNLNLNYISSCEQENFNQLSSFDM